MYMDKIMTNKSDYISSVISKIDNSEEKFQTENLLHSPTPNSDLDIKTSKKPNTSEAIPPNVRTVQKLDIRENDVKTNNETVNVLNTLPIKNNINYNPPNEYQQDSQYQLKQYRKQQEMQAAQNRQLATSKRRFDLFDLALPNVRIPNPATWFHTSTHPVDKERKRFKKQIKRVNKHQGPNQRWKAAKKDDGEEDAGEDNNTV